MKPGIVHADAEDFAMDLVAPMRQDNERPVAP